MSAKLNYCFMRFPQGRAKALTLSYDDGVEQDIRLIELMKKFGFKGTFNVSFGEICPPDHTYTEGEIYRPMKLEQMEKTYDWDGVEIGVHGYHHPHLDELIPSVVMQEIFDDRLGLESKFGGVVRGMAYPYGTYNDKVIEILHQAGICYARTIKSSLGFDLPKDWFQLNATCHHKNPKLMELAEEFLEMSVPKEAKLFYLWGHSFEFERDNTWDVIETFFERMANHSEIWYATNIEIYDYVKAYERLIYSCQGKRIFNPSAVDVWIACGEETYCIPAGKVIDLE